MGYAEVLWKVLPSIFDWYFGKLKNGLVVRLKWEYKYIRYYNN